MASALSAAVLSLGSLSLLASAAAGALICVVLTFVQNCPFNKGAAGQLDDAWRAFGLICEAVAGGAFALLVAREDGRCHER